MRNHHFALTLIAFCFMASFAYAQTSESSTKKTVDEGAIGTSENPYVVPKTEAKIALDGVLDEELWQEALVIELKYEVRPGENVPPPVKTEVLMTYNRTNLYIGFRCFDPEPSAICAHLSDHDQLGNDDWCGVVLDTFNDERRSFDFLATALGVKYDAVSDDDSWDAIWDCAGKITDWGYAVEMSIPFSALRFQRTSEAQVWGFDAVRRYPRDKPYHIGVFPRDRNNNCYLCQALKIKGFEGVSPGRNIELDPTVTAVRTDTKTDFPSGDFETSNKDVEAGLTARWGITPNMTFNAAVNPDFSQVEADSLQLDINQPFALYYQEKRPFFTEGRDFFSTLEDIVYTRTMRSPQWGLKLTGKEGGNTIGAYVVRDDITNLIFPGSQRSSATSLSMANTSSVFRYKKDIGNKYTLGLLATDREATDYYNRLFGFDGFFRLTQRSSIAIQILGSSTRYPDSVAYAFDQPKGGFSDKYISFEWDYESRNWGWWADYEEIGTNFRADLGFIPMVDFRNVEGGAWLNWIAKPGLWWSQVTVGSELNYFEDQSGQLLNKRAKLWLRFRGTMHSFLVAEATRMREAYNFSEFDITNFLCYGEMRPTSNLGVGFFTVFGDRIDYANTRPGKRLLLNPGINFNIGMNLRVSFNHAFERLTVDAGRLYTANISEMTTIYQLNVRTFFRSIIQYVDYDYSADLYTFARDPEFKRLFTQWLFSYKINPQTVLFIGYSDNYFGNQDIGLTQNDRTFFVKLGYAWVL